MEKVISQLSVALFWVVGLALAANGEVDEDLWWHLRVGELIRVTGALPTADPFSYTATGLVWWNHEWLSDLTIATVYHVGGAKLLFLLHFAAVIGVVASIDWLTSRACDRSNARPLDAAAVWLVATIALVEIGKGLGTRPQVFTYGSLALLIGIASRWGRAETSWLRLSLNILLLTIWFTAWANIHAGWIAGVVFLCGLLAYEIAVNRPRAKRLVPYFFACIAAAIGSCLTPYGPGLYGYITAELTRSHPITEWQPITVNIGEHTAFLLLVAVFLALNIGLIRYKSLRVMWSQYGPLTVASLVAIPFACLAQRHTPLVVLLMLMPMVCAISTSREHKDTELLSRPALGLVNIALGIGVALKVTMIFDLLSSNRLALVYRVKDYPKAALSFLMERTPASRVAVPLEWGGYVLAHAGPAHQVSIDGRFATLYPESIVTANFELFNGQPGWDALLNRTASEGTTQAIIAPHRLPHIETNQDWVLGFRDDTAVLYLHRGLAAITSSVKRKTAPLRSRHRSTSELLPIDPW